VPRSSSIRARIAAGAPAMNVAFSPFWTAPSDWVRATSVETTFERMPEIALGSPATTRMQVVSGSQAGAAPPGSMAQGPGGIVSRMSSWSASSSSFTLISSRCRCRCRHGVAGDAGVGQDFDVAVGQALLISAAERLLGDHLPAGSAFSLPRLEAVVVRGFLRAG